MAASQKGAMAYTIPLPCLLYTSHLDRTSTWGYAKLFYSPDSTAKAARLLLSVADQYKGNNNFEYDLVDVVRQSLADKGNVLLEEISQSYDRKDKDSFGKQDVYKRQTYAWGLYGVFTNTNILRIPGTNGAYASATSYTSDIYAGYLMRRQGDGNPYAFQNVSSSSSGNGWAFSFVYRVNVMLANIDNSGMTDADKAHWRSVGYFFRAYYYSELIARFGDVPWVDRVLGDSDKEIAYGPRTPVSYTHLQAAACRKSNASMYSKGL